MKKLKNLIFLLTSLFFLNLSSFLNAHSTEEPMPLQKEQLFTALATKLRNRTLIIARNSLITGLAYVFNTQINDASDVSIVSNTNLTRFAFSLVVTHYFFADSLLEASFNVLRGVKDTLIVSLFLGSYSGANRSRQTLTKIFCLTALYGPELINLELLYKTLGFMLRGNKIHKIN